MTLVDDLREIEKADAEYQIAKNYWEGKRIKELFSSKFAAQKLGSHATKYMVNIAKRAGEAVLFKLHVQGFSVQRDGKEDPVSDKLFKEHVVKHNELLQVVSDWINFVIQYGDAYLLDWDDVSAEDSQGVDVIAYDPIGCRIFYDVETERTPRRWVRTWMVRGERSTAEQDSWYRRVDVIDHERKRKLIATMPGKELPTSDDGFKPFTDEDMVFEDPDTILTADTPEGLVIVGPGEVVHGYGGLPVFHGRTRRPYGVPEHESLYGLQNLMIKDISTLAAAMDGYGLPFRWRTLLEGAALRAGTEAFDEDEEGGEADERIQADAGAMANLYGTDKVGQLEPSSVDNLLDPIDKIMMLASSISTTPVEFFSVSANASGEARKQNSDPFVSKCQTRLEDLNVTCVKALEFAANRILGLDDVTVVLEWKPVQERTRLEVYAQVTAAVAAGMPPVEAWVEAGYDREEVLTWDLSSMELDALAKRLRDVAAAMKDFGSAAALGVGKVDEIAAMAAAVLRTERTPEQVGA